MKKIFFLWMGAMLMLAGCSSDDNDTIESTLYYKTWKLVSYGNESTDGTYTGWAYGNQMGGEYNCTGHKIRLSHPYITKVYYESSDPDEFYLTHLCDVSTFEINARELRLYYSKDEYFKFRILVTI